MAAKVMVLEDDPFTRISIVAPMRKFGYDVVIEEATPGPALEMAKSAKPDIAILDLHLGLGATGLDVAVELRKHLPRIGIVLLTSYEDPRLLNPSLPPVPTGTVYLTKQAVVTMASLQVAAEESVRMHEWLDEKPKAPVFGSLTDVQIETLRLVAQGLSNAEIASQRCVNEKSIEQTISRVAKALRIKSEPNSNQRIHMARVYFRAVGLRVDVPTS
jgi:DNA-binding NarL/FixJ family response regulator